MVNETAPRRRGIRFRRVLLWGLVFGLALGATGVAAFKLSPWPGVWLIRVIFDRGSAAASAGLEKHLPSDVAERLDVVYDASDPDARMDVFFPARVAGAGERLPTLVWVHGGAWVSGDENQIANYARIVAARGFTVVSINYTIAPTGRYPRPVRQVHAALAHLAREAAALHVDAGRLFLAGDSAGSHIAAQVAATAVSAEYAKALGVTPAVRREQFRGMVLFCGAYDLEAVSLDGPFGGFLRTVLWAYTGRKDFKEAPELGTFSVIRHVDGAFPPAFISAGNADPLLGQSLAFADALVAKGVRVERLFFPEAYEPRLGHEYQFSLDIEAGREALERVVAFLKAESVMEAPEVRSGR